MQRVTSTLPQVRSARHVVSLPPRVQSDVDVSLRTPFDVARRTLLTVNDEWAARDFMNQRSELPFS